MLKAHALLGLLAGSAYSIYLTLLIVYALATSDEAGEYVLGFVIGTVMLFLTPIMFCLAGVFMAYFYWILSKYLGSIVVELTVDKKTAIASFGVHSIARVSALMGLAGGLLYGGIFLLFYGAVFSEELYSLIGYRIDLSLERLPLMVLASTVLCGFIVPLAAGFYNVLSKRFGGIDIKLGKNKAGRYVLKGLDACSVAKCLGLVSAIESAALFLAGLLVLLLDTVLNGIIVGVITVSLESLGGLAAVLLISIAIVPNLLVTFSALTLVSGYLSGGFFAIIYNFVSKTVGGLEADLTPRT